MTRSRCRGSTSSTLVRSGLHECDATDRDQQALREWQLHRHSRWRLARKELRIELVELWESARVGNEDGRVDHELGTAGARAKHCIEVPKRLSCLLAEARAGRSCGPRINP